MHVIGQAYQQVFLGALEANIRWFENQFNVQTEPEKTSFESRTGKLYSFDFNGVYNHPLDRREVFGECKGYSRGAGLLNEYRSFLAKAYVTSVDHDRHRHDYFWFVTNVPFACDEGSGILSCDFVSRVLKDTARTSVKDILGDGHVDDALIRTLVARLGVFILTDSFLKSTELSYKIKGGDTLWTILEKLHAGRAPSGFGEIARLIAHRNGLRSPDHIVSGRRIRMPWYGISKRLDEHFAS